MVGRQFTDGSVSTYHLRRWQRTGNGKHNRHSIARARTRHASFHANHSKFGDFPVVPPTDGVLVRHDGTVMVRGFAGHASPRHRQTIAARTKLRSCHARAA